MESKIDTTLDELTAVGKFAVGNDLVYIPDFALSFNDLFKNKAYTPNEIAYCEQFDNSMLHYASTWAAKEATYKAIKQLDSATLGWKKIEIVRDKAAGKPSVHIHQDISNFKISLTISHDGDYAWAITLIENNL